MLSSVWAITRNSFIEIIRQPVYGILLLVGMMLIGSAPAVTMFSMARDNVLMVDMGLATIMLLGLVIAVLSATQVFSREIEVQTVGAILSKPVGRLAFVLGKFLAVSLSMLVVCYLQLLMLLAVLRIGVPSAATWRLDWPAFMAVAGPFALSMGLALYGNFFYRWNFTSTAIIMAVPLFTAGFLMTMVVNSGWEMEFLPHILHERHAWPTAQAAVLVFMAVWVLSAVAVAASTRLNVVMNVIVCVTVFFLGMTSQFMFGRFADNLAPAWRAAEFGFSSDALSSIGSALVASVCWVAQRVVPNLYLFWVGDQLVADIPIIPMRYVASAAAYAVAFCGAMVALAAFLFERREVI